MICEYSFLPIIMVCALKKGQPSLAGLPLFQNSPPDCFEIHPLRSALRKGEFRRCGGDRGAALDLQALLRKGGLTRNLSDILTNLLTYDIIILKMNVPLRGYLL